MNAAGRARAHDARGVAMNEGHTHGEIDMATVTVAKQERVRNERMGSVAFDAEGTLPRISDKVRGCTKLLRQQQTLREEAGLDHDVDCVLDVILGSLQQIENELDETVEALTLLSILGPRAPKASANHGGRT